MTFRNPDDAQLATLLLDIVKGIDTLNNNFKTIFETVNTEFQVNRLALEKLGYHVEQIDRELDKKAVDRIVNKRVRDIRKEKEKKGKEK